ncbi:hypothetical protein HG536_0B05650 [Torulaspora globosa]|uniref:Ubiquitin carboxyl-terminal hydrolase n=1 Tax=Torulaspora globosa TaxID=48254 RepID=A0A7G3ZDW4_9SACH|nr:uncharacterized protein HG536_0B05650 [Torulaspora globosa]QLL31700.1 hypothetical protein HG536_0B05650 [Torulaspora globosa]
MLKRWLSRSSKRKSSAKDDSDTSSNSVVEVNYHHEAVQSTDSFLKPVRGKSMSKSKIPSAVGYNQTQSSQSSDKRSVSEQYTGNDTAISLLSTSLDTAFDASSPGLLFTNVTESMPFGDGSNKVFGYENFGNTCYCNSVLQCLYNLTEFRLQLLQYPERDPTAKRKRKSEMPGNKPRYFTESSFQHVNFGHESGGNGHHHHHHDARSVDANHGTLNGNNRINGKDNEHNGGPDGEDSNERPDSKNSNDGHKPNFLQRRNSSFLFRKLDNTTKENSETQSKEATGPVHATLMASDAMSEKLHEESRNVIVGRPLTVTSSYPEGNQTATGTGTAIKHPGSEHVANNIEATQDTATQQKTHKVFSSEQRKKAALIRGPVLNIDHQLDESNVSNLYYGLKDIFESITENLSLTGVVSPICFVDTLKRTNVLFNTTMHQDAHEFLNFLLNELSEFIQQDIDKTTDPARTYTNFINSLFQGTLTYRIKCLTCDNTTSRDEPFLDFPIEVHEEEETDIQALLQSYQQREMLSGSNKFYCNECCGLQEAERMVGLKQLPHILALHLKRFKYSEEHNSNIKLFNKIHYPLILNVCSSFCSSVRKKYELAGIVVHMGGGPQHGHYVSLCKNDKFGWLLFDDETVEVVSESTVLKFIGDKESLTTAYVLFYKELIDEEKYAKEDDKNEFEENIEQLISCDDLIRLTSQKANAQKMASAAVEEAQEHDKDEIHSERKGSSSSSKKSRPKSKLFNFMRS